MTFALLVSCVAAHPQFHIFAYIIAYSPAFWMDPSLTTWAAQLTTNGSGVPPHLETSKNPTQRATQVTYPAGSTPRTSITTYTGKRLSSGAYSKALQKPAEVILIRSRHFMLYTAIVHRKRHLSDPQGRSSSPTGPTTAPAPESAAPPERKHPKDLGLAKIKAARRDGNKGKGRFWQLSL